MIQIKHITLVFSQEGCPVVQLKVQCGLDRWFVRLSTHLAFVTLANVLVEDCIQQNPITTRQIMLLKNTLDSSGRIIMRNSPWHTNFLNNIFPYLMEVRPECFCHHEEESPYITFLNFFWHAPEYYALQSFPYLRKQLYSILLLILNTEFKRSGAMELF